MEDPFVAIQREFKRNLKVLTTQRKRLEAEMENSASVNPRHIDMLSDLNASLAKISAEVRNLAKDRKARGRSLSPTEKFEGCVKYLCTLDSKRRQEAIQRLLAATDVF